MVLANFARWERADGSERLFRWGLAAILSISALLRAVYLKQTLDDPLLRDLLILDSRIYDEMATRIAGGDWAAGNETFALGPLYAYLLAILRRIFGAGTAAIYSFQQLLGLASIALTALLARRCFGVRAALVAALAIGLYGAMALLEVKVMASTLAVFLSLASLELLLVARDRNWRKGTLLPGVTIGLACLARPNTLLFLPAAAFWLSWSDGRGSGSDPRARFAGPTKLLFFATGVALAIAPVTLRNYVVTQQWTLISSQGGITFYQANNDRARGLYTKLPGFAGPPTEMLAKARAYAEEDLGRALTVSEVNSYWTWKGVDFLVENPAVAVKLVATKLRYWTTTGENSTEYVLPVERDLTPALRLMPLPFGAIFALAILGLIAARSARPDHVLLHLFVLTNLAGVLIFYFSSRYRMPAVPVLAVFAGAGAVAAFDLFHSDRRRLGVALAASLIAAAYSLHSWSDHLRAQGAQQLFNYAQIYGERGLWDAAIDKYRAALILLPERWQMNLSLANAYLQSGDRAAALGVYERILESHERHPVAVRRARLLRAELGRAQD